MEKLVIFTFIKNVYSVHMEVLVLEVLQTGKINIDILKVFFHIFVYQYF